jgi:hypothetical protein
MGTPLRSPSHFETARASLGCDTYTEWLAPANCDHVAISSLGVPSFKVMVHGSVFCHYQLWFASPRTRGDDSLETKNVLTTAIDFLSQTGALQQCRFVVLSVLFSVHPLADVRRTVLKLHAIRLATP